VRDPAEARRRAVLARAAAEIAAADATIAQFERGDPLARCDGPMVFQYLYTRECGRILGAIAEVAERLTPDARAELERMRAGLGPAGAAAVRLRNGIVIAVAARLGWD
jgi:hypothetical protein